MASNLPPGVTNADIDRAAGGDGYTGEELYAMYARKHAERNCTVDAWDDLEQSERDVWCALATELMP